MPPTIVIGGSTRSMLVQTPPPPRVVGLTTDPPHRSTSSDTSTEELSPALLGAIQQIVSAATQEQVAALALDRVNTPSDVDTPEEEAEGDIPAPLPPTDRKQGTPPLPSQDVPPQ
ncbi:UNVERIFIED_CONTAM: hypothetical protein Sangu_1255600 [Sesamum angustifolium]|uniref:Uncharacterized protein n=1 Tax=Sesamum angustifolium TaxID=2727405 RepID=A0AAW2NI56_9LAMI